MEGERRRRGKRKEREEGKKEGMVVYNWNTGVCMCSYMCGLLHHVQPLVRSARHKKMHDEAGPGPEASEWFTGSLHFRNPDGGLCMHRKAVLIPDAGENE